jgi:hypothetical protein
MTEHKLDIFHLWANSIPLKSLNGQTDVPAMAMNEMKILRRLSK